MTFKWDTTDVDTSSVIKAEHVNEPIDALQAYVNEGIGSRELKGHRPFVENDRDPYERTGWVTSDLIYRPEFYGAPSPRMMAVSGQTHFRKTPYDWTKGAIFHADVTGSAWQGVPGCCTTIKLRHSATVNIMCSFYMFELGGVTESQAKAMEDTKTGRQYSGDHPPPNHILTGADSTAEQTAGSFIRNKLESPPKWESSETSVTADRYFGYETKSAGRARISVNGNPYASTERPIYTSHVDARLPERFKVSDGEGYQWEDTWYQTLYASNSYIFMPMIGRHQHHIAFQVELSEGIHDIGLVFKPSRISERMITHAAVQYQNRTFFRTKKEFSKYEVPKIPRNKNVFILARNLVVDCYYKDNEPL